MGQRKYRSRSEWTALIDQQEQSGLSVLDFCRDQGLYAKTFYKQRKALGRSPSRPQAAPPSRAFVQVQPLSSAAVSGASGRMMLHHQDCWLHLPESVDPLWIAKLLQALS